MNRWQWLGMFAGCFAGGGATAFMFAGIYGHVWAWFALAIWVACAVAALLGVSVEIRKLSPTGSGDEA